MFRLVLVFLFSTPLMAQTLTPDEIKDALAHAEALYYEAQFKDSIDVLTRIDGALQTKPDRLQDRTRTKLQLALANIGLNETDRAKAYFRELYALDSNYVMNASEFSPKVIALANDARAEQNKLRCQAVGNDARGKLAARDVTGVRDALGSMKSVCPDLAALEPDVAELLFKAGVDAYKRGDFPEALQQFQTAVKLAPKHELAPQYLELTQAKLQVSRDLLFLDWQKNFDAHLFPQAAANYREMATAGGSGNAQNLDLATAAYRQALTALVDSWNKTCPTGNKVAMDAVRNQINDVLPDPSFGEDIRSRMLDCKKTGCVPTKAALALTRLKTRVNPEISPGVRTFIRSSMTVRARIRIDEGGNVTVNDIRGENVAINNSVRSAMERWKFSPAVDQSGPRCVDTEIPIVITP
jgi:tetratricopeptide (TPR) repeat protein